MIQRRTTRLAAGLLGAATAGAGLLVYPAWRAAASVRVEIAQAQRQIGSRDDRPAELERERETLVRLEAFAAEHTRPLPGQSDVASLVRGLSVYLDELGIASREVATGTPTRSGPITVMPMTLTMRCDFLGACAVVVHVESLPRLVRIRRFRLAHEKGDSAEASLSAPLKAELLLEVLSADAPPPTDKMATPEKGREP